MSRRFLIALLALCLAPLRVSAQNVAPVPKEKLVFVSAQKTAAAMRTARADDKSCAAQPPLEAMLQVKAPPKVGQPVTLLLSVLPQQTLNNFTTTWDADATVTLINAPQKRAAFAMAKDKLVTFPLTVSFPGPGLYRVTARATERGQGFTAGREISLYFDVTAQAITVLPMRPWKEKALKAERLPANAVIAPANPALRGVAPTDHPAAVLGDAQPRVGTTRLTGRFYYLHHDNTLHAAWNSIARVFRSGAIVADAIINSDGTWDSGNFTNSGPVNVQFLPINSRVEVQNVSGASVPVNGPNPGNVSDGTHPQGDLFIDTSGPGSYPDNGYESYFEICETGTREWLQYSSLGYDISKVIYQWGPGNTDGGYYTPSAQVIRLRDGDQYDPSVILHEYGHHVMNIVKGGMPPSSGGAHSWFSSYTPGLAWSEGWATYSGQSTLNSTVYSDTPGAGQSGQLIVDIENTTGNFPSATAGSTTESSVLSCLWDMYDNLAGDAQPHDYIGVGAANIFDTFRNGGTFNSARDFLIAYIARNPGNYGQVRWWCSDHNITLYGDSPSDFYVDKTYGGVERGTPSQPFRSVLNAVSAANTGTTTNVYIRGFNYADLFATSKPVALFLWGNGVVHLGNP